MRSLVLAAILLGALHTASSGQTGSRRAQFRPERVVESTSRYVMLVQGSERGAVRVTTTIENGVASFTQDTRVAMPAGEMVQKVEIRFNASNFQMLSSTYSTEFGGTRAETRVTYDGNHVTGEGQTPGPRGVTTAPIDMTVDSGTVDAGVAWALFGTLDLEERLRLSFPAFDPSTGTVSMVDLRVTGRGEVAVPAGTFDAWTVDVEGFGGTLRYHIGVAPPHAILIVAPLGVPQEIRLVERS